MTRRLLGPLVALAAATLDAGPQSTAALPPSPKGQSLYVEMCSACHMPAGVGVRGQQPSLVRNKRVVGETGALIQLLLDGTAALPPHRRKFPNEMPAFESLTDEQIAEILTYVRGSFGNKAGAITAAQVAAGRGQR